VTILETKNNDYEVDKIPDFCPLCHHGIMPNTNGGVVIDRDAHQGNIIQGLFICPREKCQRVFIAMYWQDRNRFNPEGIFKLRSTMPWSAKDPVVSEEINNISPEYKKILAQSSSAEQHNLDQIAGMGYRKALEYLIKDFCCHKFPDKSEKIKSLFLSNCINDFVDDKNVQECSKRASWLGNDESHYVRKWEEKDIVDLKILLGLTEAWITNNLLTEKYLADMQLTKTPIVKT
jgi:hypothetical protein